MSTKLIIVLIIWLIGTILALLGEKRLRDYKDFRNPTTFLIIGIILCVITSWLMVLGALINRTFEFPKKKLT